MADLNFPQNPLVGDSYTIGTRTWVWNGSGWVLQSGIVSTNPFIVITAQVTSVTNAISTNSGALIVAGGAGFGGDVHANNFYINGSAVLTTSSAVAGVSAIIAGTDTSVSSSTGAVTVWNVSTLQSVTNRGATTNKIISITTATESTGSTSGALVVTGGVGIGGNVNIAGSETVGAESANKLVLTGSASAGAVTITATGTDATVNLNITTKGDASTIITSTLTSLTTASQALYVTGGVGIEQRLFAKEIFESSKRVLTAITPSAGAGISITAVTTGNGNANFTVNNTGVRSLVGTAGIGLSSSTGDITVSNFGVTAAVGTTYIGVSDTTGSVTLTNLGVQTLTAGTDTAVSSNTGTVVVWNESTLETVTGRGATTNNALSITNTTTASSTNSGALKVTGGVGIGGNLWVGGEIVASKLTIELTTVTTTLVTTDDIIKTTNATVSTDVNSGALQVTGGAGIGGTIWAGDVHSTSPRIGLGSPRGWNSQGDYSIALGNWAGSDTQGISSIAIGNYAGSDNQGTFGIAIGDFAGQTQQGQNSVAIGRSAGTVQGQSGVAIGYNSGNDAQNNNAVSVGAGAGQTNQGTSTVAIGFTAGNSNQGQNAVAIGTGAGQNSQHANSIVISANGTLQSVAAGFHVSPVRADASLAATTWALYYNPSTKELTTASVASFNGGNVNNATTFASTVTITSGAQAISTSSGALTVSGGAGIGRNLYVGGDIVVYGTINGSIVGNTSTATNLANGSAGAIAYQTTSGQTSFISTTSVGEVLVSNATDSPRYQNTLTLAGLENATSSTNSGAFQVFGGAAIAKDLQVGGKIYIGGVEAITTATISQYATQTTINAGTDISVNTTTGNVTVSNVSTLQSVTGRGAVTTNAVAISNLTQADSTITGALTVSGGLGVGKTLFANDYRTTAESIHIGRDSGITNQGTSTVAIGYNAGSSNQGRFGIAIGYNAGLTSQYEKSIVLNASGNTLNATTSGAYISPVRADDDSTVWTVFYNPTTKELTTASGALQFDGGTIGLELILTTSTQSSSTASGALQVSGGAGIGRNLYVGENIDVDGQADIGGQVIVGGKLTVSSTATLSGNLVLGLASEMRSSASITTATTATLTVDSFTITEYRTVKYLVQAADTSVTPNKVHVTELMVFHDNNGGSTIPYMIQYAIGSNTGELGTWDAVRSGGNIVLQFTPNYTPGALTVKAVRTAITT